MIEVDPGPFDLGHGARAAALCLHGLTGTPYEVRSLGEALARRGLRAVGPALPGHGTLPAELARVPYTEWLDEARGALAALRASHERVFVVGLSLGGLLGLALAAEERVDGLVVVGTPLRLHFAAARLVPLVKHLVPRLPKRTGSDIRDAEARARHPSYPVMPLPSVHELQKLQRRVRASLSRVTAPIFVGHGAHDSTAHPMDARLIAARVGSPCRVMHVFPDSAHIVPVDRDAETLGRAVVAFVDGVESRG